MGIYVAGSPAELTRAKRAMALLRERGMAPTSDWTISADLQEADKEEVTEEARRIISAAAIDAVLSSEGLWFLLPEEDVVGAWVVLGAFLGAMRVRGKVVPTVMSGTRPERSVFASQVHACFDKDVDAAEWLLSRIRKQ